MILRLKPTELRVGDEILTLNFNGVIKEKVPVTELELCRSHIRGVPRVHVNGTLCYDDCGTFLDVNRR